MNKNNFIFEPSTSEINKFLIKSGYGTIDCNAARVYQEIKGSSENYDQTNSRPILKSEFVYLPDFPSKVIDYDRMLEYGKEKYYWDSLHQKLYKFKLQENVKPFVPQSQIIRGCDSSPSAGGIAVENEFSKTEGIWEETYPKHAISTYIPVKGHPSQYALRPYVEGTYYLDTVHNKYYLFISNYTLNKDNWYYDRTLENSEMLKYVFDAKAWTRVNAALVLSEDPNSVIIITEDNIDTIDKRICYCDKVTDTLYYFDYGQYFERVLYSGIIYERPLEFYRKLQDVFLDISGIRKVPSKDIFYTWGHPRKVKNPVEGRYYYDSKNQKYYEYTEATGLFTEIIQENLLVPQTFFPHTHGDISKAVTLAYYDIIDCYTKKEVDRLMPVIPGYISYFENDLGYIYQHQDISGKQDKLTQEELTALNSGVTYNQVRSWENQGYLLFQKQDTLTTEQLEALGSGITVELVARFDAMVNLINRKANKSTTLKGYGIKDAYTTNELETCLKNLTKQLNNAS
jgi:hypothetical protein